MNNYERITSCKSIHELAVKLNRNDFCPPNSDCPTFDLDDEDYEIGCDARPSTSDCLDCWEKFLNTPVEVAP